MKTIKFSYVLLAIFFGLSFSAGAQPGTLDSDFDADGKVTTDLNSGSIDFLQDIVVQPDEKIIAAGYTTAGSDNAFALVRYYPDGTLDNTFGTGGKVVTDYGSLNDELYGVALQTDGKIVCCGITENGTDIDFVVVRYNSNGTLDATFNTTGIFQIAIGSANDVAQDIAIQNDGKIVVAGFSATTNYLFAAARLNSNGTLDPTFSIDGKVTTAIGTSNNHAMAVAIQPDGKIVLAGTTENTTTDGALVRYNSDGTLDTGFDMDGKVTFTFGASDDICKDVVVRADGKIIIGGYTDSFGGYDFALAQFNADGSPDTDFSFDGAVVTDMGSDIDWASAICLQPDNKILLAGFSGIMSDFNFALARYNEDGTLDADFNGSGKVITAIGSAEDYLTAMAIQPDGRIVVGGYFYNGSEYDLALARYISGVNIGFDEPNKAPMQVYPNPAQTFIQVELMYPETETPVALYNAQGQKLFGQIYNENSPAMDVSFLNPGLYFIRIESGRNAGVKGFLKE